MNVSASTPGGLISACLSAIQSYHATARQAEQVAASITQPQRAAPAGMTHLPAVGGAAPVQESASIPRVAVQAAQRAYETNLAASNAANRLLVG
jgi:hypothetical protein